MSAIFVQKGFAVATGLTATALLALSISKRPQDSVWLQIDDEVVLVGELAKAYVKTTHRN